VGGGVAAFAHAHEVVHSECDASRARVDAAQLDFFTNARASSSQYKYLTDLGRTVEECQILLCMQEMDLEVWEAILLEELERSLHPSEGRDLSAKLDEARTCVNGINSECATEAKRL
jgi:hypothetical protein